MLERLLTLSGHFKLRRMLRKNFASAADSEDITEAMFVNLN